MSSSENFRDMPYERLEASLYANSNSSPQDIVTIIHQKTISGDRGTPFDDIIITAVKREG